MPRILLAGEEREERAATRTRAERARARDRRCATRPRRLTKVVANTLYDARWYAHPIALSERNVVKLHGHPLSIHKVSSSAPHVLVRLKVLLLVLNAVLLCSDVFGERLEKCHSLTARRRSTSNREISLAMVAFLVEKRRQSRDPVAREGHSRDNEAARI